MVIIIGKGNSVLALPATGLVSPGADVVLAGVAKALNPRFQVGDVFAVTSVKKEGQAGTLSLRVLPSPSLPEASLATCDRVVYRSGEAADLADMEGYYAATVFTQLAILRAVSDRDEDLEFLNLCVRDGRLSWKSLFRRLTPRRALAIIRFGLNLRRASRKLADVLLVFIETRGHMPFNGEASKSRAKGRGLPYI
jgi:hypothetical protein